MISDNRYAALGIKPEDVFLLDRRNNKFLMGRLQKPLLFPSRIDLWQLFVFYFSTSVFIVFISIPCILGIITTLIGEKTVFCGTLAQARQCNPAQLILYILCVPFFLFFGSAWFTLGVSQLKVAGKQRQSFLERWPAAYIIKGTVAICSGKTVTIHRRGTRNGSRRSYCVTLYYTYQHPQTNSIVTSVTTKTNNRLRYRQMTEPGTTIVIVLFILPYTTEFVL